MPPKKRKKKEGTAEAEATNTRVKQLSTLQKSIVGKLLVLFKAFPVVERSNLPNSYAALPGPRALQLHIRGHGFSSLEDMYKKLDIFEYHRGGQAVAIDVPKLLELLLRPLMASAADSHHQANLLAAFRAINGFDVEVLCDYCRASSLEELMDKLPQERLFFIDKAGSSVPVTEDSIPSSPSFKESTVPLPPQSPSLSVFGNHPIHRGPHVIPPRGIELAPPHPLGPLPPRRPLLPHPFAPGSHMVPHSAGIPPYPRIGPFPPHGPMPIKRPAVPVIYDLPQDESPPPHKRGTYHEDVPEAPLAAAGPTVPVKPVISQTGLKESPQSVLTFTPSDVSSHFPNPSVHPRDEVQSIPNVSEPSLHFVSKEDMRSSLPALPKFSSREDEKSFLEKISTYLQTFAGILSSHGKHLPLEVMEEELKKVMRYSGRRIDRRSIAFFKDWEMLYKRVKEFINVFCWHSPITSLYELQRTLNEFEKVSDFRELKMGPLVKHPQVIQLFKVPEDLLSVPEITAYDIHSKLFVFLNKSKKGEKKHNFEDFLKFLTEKFEVSSPHHLCIRISSFPLACQINFKFRTSQRLIRERMEAENEKNVKEALEFEINNWKRSLSRMSSEIPRELERKDPVQILQMLLESSVKWIPSRLQSRLMSLIQLFTEDSNLRKMFLLAIYEGVYGVQKMAQEMPSTASATNYPSVPSQPQQLVYRTKSEIHNELIRLLKMVSFPIDLESLASTEQQLTAKLGASHFHCFSHGTFLEFITKHQTILTALGGNTIGSDGVEGNRKRREEVLMCLRQLKDLSDLELVSSVLMEQFGVDSITQLECGTLERLISDAQTHPVHSSSIHYLSPLLSNSNSSTAVSSCPMGSMTHADALKCLQAAPLLSDLSVWSNWDLIFKPSLGPLSQFLHSQEQSSAGKGDRIAALLVSPDQFLKISAGSTIQDFTAAVDGADALMSAGHLVSLAVKAGSVSNVSTQLLAQHVHTKLISMCSSTTDDHVSPEEFVFECLVCIPVQLCASIGNQVFLDPLRRVTSSSTVNEMLRFCKTPNQRSFLQALGMRLGVKAWMDDYKEMQQQAIKPISPVTRPVEPVPEKMDITPFAEPSLVISSNVQTDNESNSMAAEEKESMTTSPPLPVLTVEELQQEEDKCKAIVSAIRRDEFGIGQEQDLNERQKLISDKQNKRLGRSLQRLSEELYSKDTHFVLELVQNADDNSYTVSSAILPSLKFVLSNDCIAVLNNERGFTESNIRAICDVGKSTKDRHCSGYIGQKGIGFKSVFRVTEQPEIHSCGFHIKFDVQSGGPIGYILPQWVTRSYIEGKLEQIELSRWTTRIVLPLKSDSSSVSQNMMSKFQDIQPSLLLFLNRLRYIVIEDLESKIIREMKRHDRSNGIIEIRHNDGIDKWLVVRKKLNDASKYKPEVAATELALAFPLPDDLHNPSSARELSSQQVFAFLPLRSYGFHFIVQGDFDLPSSREDVNANSAWNQWLREMLPSLFMEASESFKRLPGLTEIEAMSLMMQFIPLEGEIHDFFQPVTGEILRLFKGRECLPTDPSPANSSTPTDAMNDVIAVVTKQQRDDKSIIEWKQPSQLLIVKQQLVCDCIPQSLLSSALKLYYLNTALAGSLSHDLCSQLSIGTLSIDHLIVVAEFVLASYLMHKSDQFHQLMSNTTTAMDIDYDDDNDEEAKELDPVKCYVRWLALWLASAYSLLEDTEAGGGVAVLNKLRKLPIIPLSNGDIVSLESTAVFFQPMSDRDLDKSFRAIYKELHTVHPELHNSNTDDVDTVVSAKVSQLLLRLDVKELNSIDIIEHHIIPQFKQESIMTKDKKLLVLYLAFIKRAIDKGEVKQQQKVIANLKEDVVLLTNQGRFRPSNTFIYFHSDYKNQWDLPAKFPGVKWITVSPEYLTVKLPWKEFLSELGVQSELAVKRINRSQANAEASHWKRSPDGQYTVHDYCCTDFNAIVQSVQDLPPEKQIKQMILLAELLDKHWDSSYKNYINAPYYDGSDTHELGKIVSNFGQALVSTSWLPAVNLEHKPSHKLLSALAQGNQLYQMTDKLRHLLYKHVPYLGADLRNHDFIRHLKVRVNITPEELLESLCSWSQAPAFSTTPDHMRQVYVHLSQNSQFLHSIGRYFQEKLLIFVPAIEQWRNLSSMDISGSFVSVNKACWADKTTVLFNRLKKGQGYPEAPHLPQILSFFYGSTGDSRETKFAFESLGVAKVMNLDSLIDLLEFNASISLPTEALIESFCSIVMEVLKAIEKEGSSPSFNEDLFLAKTKKLKIFPSKSKKWVSLEGLFFDNEPEVSKHFSKDDQVHFLSWPSKGAPNPLPFVQVCKIPLVNENVTVAFNPSAVRPYSELKIRFHYIIPIVQRFLLKTFSTEQITFEHYQKVAKILKRLQFFSTLEMTCTYCLDSKYYASASLKQCKLDITADPPVVYAVVNKKAKIIEETSLVGAVCELVLPKGLKDLSTDTFVMGLLLNKPLSNSDQARIIEDNSLPPVPSELDEWCVELPPPPSQPKKPPPVARTPSSDEGAVTRDTPPLIAAEPQVGEDEGLKAWPPRAPVIMVGQTTQRPQSTSGGVAAKQERKVTHSDVITLEDVHNMREKSRFEEGNDETVIQKAKKHKQDESTLIESESTPSAISAGKLANRSAAAAAAVTTSLSHPESSPQAQSTSSSSSGAPKEQRTSQKDESHSSTNQRKRKGDAVPLENKATASNSASPNNKSPAKHDFTDSETVDITSLMHELPIPETGECIVIPKDKGKEDNLFVGRWGEEYVFKHFQGLPILPNQVCISKIEWVNQDRESGLPYDIKVTSDSETDYFIEVKSTVSKDKDLVPISWNEIKFAQETGVCYMLVRVYSACSERVQIKWLTDLVQIMEKTYLKLYLKM